MRAGALVAVVALVVVGAAAAELRAPVRVTFEGVAGVRPGMSAATVSTMWGIDIRPDYEVRPDCGETDFRRSAIVGSAVFMPHGRLGAVFFRGGVVTGRGIRVGSTVSQLGRAYRSLTWKPNRFVPGGRSYFVRRRAAPQWELRFDVRATGRVTQIVFGTHAAVRLDEGCA
jgi:hypothetical protein